VYELSEYALVVVAAVVAGGSSFVAVAAVLAVMEAIKSGHRRLHTR
jgi:hypothetical protein